MVRRGFIYWVDPGQAKGSEILGPRPYLVLSINQIAYRFRVAIAIPGTTGLHAIKIDSRVTVRVSAQETGMKADSVFLCHQIRVLDLSKFDVNPAGTVSPVTLEKIENAVKFCLGLGL